MELGHSSDPKQGLPKDMIAVLSGIERVPKAHRAFCSNDDDASEGASGDKRDQRSTDNHDKASDPAGGEAAQEKPLLDAFEELDETEQRSILGLLNRILGRRNR